MIMVLYDHSKRWIALAGGRAGGRAGVYQFQEVYIYIYIYNKHGCCALFGCEAFPDNAKMGLDQTIWKHDPEIWTGEVWAWKR